VEKVLEKLETTESATLALKREVGGKIRGRLHIARKPRHPDEWDSRSSLTAPMDLTPASTRSDTAICNATTPVASRARFGCD
jgi:hypothetical protein